VAGNLCSREAEMSVLPISDTEIDDAMRTRVRQAPNYEAKGKAGFAPIADIMTGMPSRT
jgi:hypothetical protein